MRSKFVGFVVGVWLLYAVLVVGVLGAVIYAAAHFIRKFW